MDQRDIVIIGGSRGAFGVLRTLLARLPADLPAVVCIVLHIGRHQSALADLMSKWGPLTVSHPADGEALLTGKIYMAPPDRHMLLLEGRLRLDHGVPENFARPALDPLFRSAASSYGTRVVGVVLSGDLDDGAAGLASVHAHGGYRIVQDPVDCEAPSMPRAALTAAGADVVANTNDLAQRIIAAIGGAPSAQRKGLHSMYEADPDSEALIAQREVVQPEDLDRIGERSPVTCPECGGTLWRMHDDHPLRYRCHIGHAYSALSLQDGNEKAAENAIWAALRAVNERVIFARERKRWAERVGDQQQIGIEQARIDEGTRLANMLRQTFTLKK